MSRDWTCLGPNIRGLESRDDDADDDLSMSQRIYKLRCRLRDAEFNDARAHLEWVKALIILLELLR